MYNIKSEESLTLGKTQTEESTNLLKKGSMKNQNFEFWNKN